jgi:aspartyl-tRNA(Asn)/glutamyl-tRNA(Gln) amidotransferase subunit A
VFTPLFNHALAPACSVPCGLTTGGLPIGAQLVGRRYEDGRMLAVAAALEKVAAAGCRRQ